MEIKFKDYIKPNLLTNLGVFFITLVVLTVLQDNDYFSFFISLGVYFDKVASSAKIDYLTNTINNLKNNKNV
jgi:hypothetical protein